MDLSKMSVEELTDYAANYDPPNIYDRAIRWVKVAQDLARRLAEAEARAEAAEAVVALAEAWYTNAICGCDATDEGTFEPQRKDVEALADAVECMLDKRAREIVHAMRANAANNRSGSDTQPKEPPVTEQRDIQDYNEIVYRLKLAHDIEFEGKGLDQSIYTDAAAEITKLRQELAEVHAYIRDNTVNKAASQANNTRLREQLRIAREGLEFYAKAENWPGIGDHEQGDFARETLARMDREAPHD